MPYEVSKQPPPPPQKYAVGYGWWDEYKHSVQVLPHERIERYVPGRFHPVALGDTFHNGRYTVRNKLGHGGFSTVWLARDNDVGRWTSLKIKQAYVSTTSLDDDKEVRALRVLEQNYVSSNSSSPPCFARLLDSFHHHGPNGTHTCVVTELLGPTLFHLVANYNDYQIQELFRPDTILRASRQLLEAIHMVQEYGIVHGDISSGNVAFTCYQLLENDDELEEIPGGDPIVAEYTATEPLPSHLPKHIVSAASWNGWYDYAMEDVRLVDWGESFPTSQTATATHLAQPCDLKSPETFFVGSVDYRHDLWRVGCMIYTLFHQRSPFGFSSCDAKDIQKQTQVIGPLPPKWHTMWLKLIEESPKYEPLPDNALKRLDQSFEPRRLAIISHAEKTYESDDDEYHVKDDYEALTCLLSVMEGLMQHDPEKRSFAQEAAAKIQWHDYRRDLGSDVSEEDVTESEEEQESDS
ncbi:serine/threonine protein kinase, AGC family [Metarhizium robertsii ARSEF 23]|uniref:Serine/threonine protein kinase, AGC family n=1 Tax=Metarhizium robertsii (strain ARSEF 23 / ATCC MYA-3075) TaxID=655844 RepID=A0A0B2X8V9_METRA|nr:serine/threonine protein kinase, AGC family [Metarhizium robertsii ARSEF 23]KHO11328.1 serine/threonine protein kinase, AGC family [Metarhizium robertsii ARSEF 23]